MPVLYVSVPVFSLSQLLLLFCFFFFNDTATTEIYTLSLHDALPIFHRLENRGRVRGVELQRRGSGVGGNRLHVRAGGRDGGGERFKDRQPEALERRGIEDRKSTRLNSSHLGISYAVFCLKKKKNGTSLFPDIVGYADTVIAPLVNAFL